MPRPGSSDLTLCAGEGGQRRKTNQLYLVTADLYQQVSRRAACEHRIEQIVEKKSNSAKQTFVSINLRETLRHRGETRKS